MGHVASKKKSYKYTIGHIFRKYFNSYLKYRKVTEHQRKTIIDLQKCRTPMMGGEKKVCDSCGHTIKVYRSCRNRHCPQCENIKQRKWVMQQESKLLPVPYFHAVFTVPEELNQFFLYNKSLLYDILFDSVAETIHAFAKKEYGGDIGMTMILHTWTQQLLYHPHIHIILPGGALHSSQKRWIPCKNDKFLFPVFALGKMYKAKFLSKIRDLHKNNKLKCIDALKQYELKSPFNNLLDKIYQKKWVVYCKKGFGGPKEVLKYLGNYTHKVAIRNSRIKKVTNAMVTFKYIDRKDNNIKKEMTISAYEFIRRFIRHILPFRYVRIRHYGLNTSMQKDKRRVARILLHAESLDETKVTTEMVLKDLKIDHKKCPECKLGNMIVTAVIPRQLGPPNDGSGKPIVQKI